MEPYDFIICDCISQCSEMKVQSWLNFVRCFRWYHRDVWWPLGQAGRAQQDLWPPEVPKRRMGVRWGLGALIPGQRRTARCSARGTWCYVSKILQTSGFGWKLVSIHPKNWFSPWLLNAFLNRHLSRQGERDEKKHTREFKHESQTKCLLNIAHVQNLLFAQRASHLHKKKGRPIWTRI